MEKQGELQKRISGILGMSFAPQIHCSNLRKDALPTWWDFFRVFIVVSLVILQIGCFKQIATKHTIPLNTEHFVFLG